MNMNIQQIMAEAKKVQKELDNLNSAIETTVFEGTNGPVKVTGTGKCEITKIECSDNDALKDKDAFLDMVQLAVNDMLAKIQAVKKEKLGKYTGGNNSLF